MPYKDPVKARLQKQRWAELHRGYHKVKSAECEQRNKRWKIRERKAYMRNWRKNNKARLDAYREKSKLWNADKIPVWKHADYLRRKEHINKKSAEYYRKNKNSLIKKCTDYASTHRQEINERARKYYRQNILKARERSRKASIKSYHKHVIKNRSRAVAREAYKRSLIAFTSDSSENILAFIWKLKNDPSATCSYCRKPIAGKVTIDHVHPLIRGGKHQISNICGACSECNASKGDKTISEWEEFKRLSNFTKSEYEFPY